MLPITQSHSAPGVEIGLPPPSQQIPPLWAGQMGLPPTLLTGRLWQLSPLGPSLIFLLLRVSALQTLKLSNNTTQHAGSVHCQAPLPWHLWTHSYEEEKSQAGNGNLGAGEMLQ